MALLNSGDPLGSVWRKWDLHVHTKDTLRNNQFNSATFEDFCVVLLTQALEKNVSAIGITDYFNIENYKEVRKFIDEIDAWHNKDSQGGDVFTAEKIERIKSIFLLPNVELRMLPVTDSGRLVNIHCIFNPIYVDNLDNDFFAAIEYSAAAGKKFKLNRQGLIGLGKHMDASLKDDEVAFKKGADNFVVSHETLQHLLDTNVAVRENSIVVVSNSSNDGASALQKHYDFFEDTEPGSLDAVRKSIYCLSSAIFSGNPEDKLYFLGHKKDSVDIVKSKCGSLKPCIIGCDAHSETELFAPPLDRFCWIKSDLTFEGLKQIIYEPADRVFVGKEPPLLERVRNNKTKYIQKLNIDQVEGYSEEQGVWFKKVEIPFNKELVAIIGNKGSGKSAISDILGLLGHTHNAGEKQKNLSFLNNKILKFRKKGYAENFEAELIWEDGGGVGEKVLLNQDIDVNQKERVRYLPQNYFEALTNDLENTDFDKTLKSVAFKHIPEEDRLGKSTFDELEREKIKSIEVDLSNLREELKLISKDISVLEKKKHKNFKERLASLLTEKQREFDEHEKVKPSEVQDPSKDSSTSTEKTEQYNKLQTLNTQYDEITRKIAEKRARLNTLSQEKEELSQLDAELGRIETATTNFKSQNVEKFKKFGLDIDKIVNANIDRSSLATKISERVVEIDNLISELNPREAIESDWLMDAAAVKSALEKSIVVKQGSLQTEIDALKAHLSKPERDYQEYKEQLDKWNLRKIQIEGNEDTPNTLKFYLKEKKYIDSVLMGELEKFRESRIEKVLEIYKKKKEIVDLYNSFKKSIDQQIAKDKEFSDRFKMKIDAGFRLSPDFASNFLQYINKSRMGTFRGAEEKRVLELLFAERNLLNEEDIKAALKSAIEFLENDQRSEVKEGERIREISDQIDKMEDFYEFLFSLEYLIPIYELKFDDKVLDQLSPGEKGALLLVFYLMIDKEDIPLIIDQPEDNLDNKSVFQVLTHFIKSAKKRRQIVIVTHNPNLAVGADAEQIIYVELDKQNKNKFMYELGSIENPQLNARIVEILEGTMPAFDKRKLKYLKE